MHVHILGIGGTFMAGLAILAKQMGFEVSGSDLNVYPPMSTQLKEHAIDWQEGYEVCHLNPMPSLVVIGNAMKRGNPMVEACLNDGIPYTSGPEWLYNEILRTRTVLAVAGTHGKTTTASLLAWILEEAGLSPGFLIGGVPQNFGVSSRLGQAPYFVIEADEYDTAFFDKRAKFIHYHPKIAILNNLEYDHADIYPDLAAIEREFHHLIRTIPSVGTLIYPEEDKALHRVLSQGVWSQCTSFSLTTQAPWQARLLKEDGSHFEILHQNKVLGQVIWSLLGKHNVHNAMAAFCAAITLGVSPEQACCALTRFEGVKRRLEVRGEVAGVTVYDDFAHHPTAIATTLQGLRLHVGQAKITAVVQLGSYTLRTGHHGRDLVDALTHADEVMLYPSDAYDPSPLMPYFQQPAHIHTDITCLIQALCANARAGDHLLVMSNRGFNGIHERLLQALRSV